MRFGGLDYDSDLAAGARLDAYIRWVQETLAALGRDTAGGMPAAQVARTYLASVTGTMQGMVLDVRDYA